MGVVLPTPLLAHRARAMAVVLTAEFLADWADAVVVVLTASLLAYGADAGVVVISSELVFIGHASILDPRGRSGSRWLSVSNGIRECCDDSKVQRGTRKRITLVT